MSLPRAGHCPPRHCLPGVGDSFQPWSSYEAGKRCLCQGPWVQKEWAQWSPLSVEGAGVHGVGAVAVLPAPLSCSDLHILSPIPQTLKDAHC